MGGAETSQRQGVSGGTGAQQQRAGRTSQDLHFHLGLGIGQPERIRSLRPVQPQRHDRTFLSRTELDHRRTSDGRPHVQGDDH